MPTTRPAIADIAPGIADALGDGWTVSPDVRDYDNPYEVRYLIHTDGTSVRLLLNYTSSERIVITGQLPEVPHGMDIEAADRIRRPSATADPTRPAASIAGQIRRSILPPLAERTATIRQLIDTALALETAKDALRTRLSAVPGFGLGLYWQGTPRGTWKYAPHPQASVEVKGDRDGAYAEITLRGLTADQAERVLRALTSEPADKPSA